MDVTENTVFDLEDYLEGSFSGYDNSSEDTSSESGYEFTCEDGVTGLQLFHTVFQPLVYSLVFLLGLAGNGLMLTVLLKRRGPLRITEIYLLHLALADLMLLFTFPFAVAQTVSGWVFGDFLCKLVSLLNRLNLLCGSLLLACIGFDRYLAVVHAIPSMQSRHPRMVHLTCISLWLVCLVLSTPNLVFLSVIEHPSDPSKLVCLFNRYGIHANNWLLANRFLTHVFCFFLPLAVMAYCYTAVVVTLSHSHRSLKKRGAIRLALLVTAVFCLCWLPYNVTMLVDTMVNMGVITNGSCQARAGLEQALAVTESLGFSHCCLNPFLYAFVGVRFRGELLRLFSQWGCGRVRQSLVRAETRARSSISEGVTSSSIFI